MPSDDRPDGTLDLAATDLPTESLGAESLATESLATESLAADSLAERIQAASGGLAHLIARADAVQRERAAAAKERGAPRWTDVFTTQFTEFSNRPR